jgi:DNA-directed RNA polymerase subunit RPC12/RpoP
MLILTHPVGLGYLEIDHRDSPELPAGVPSWHFESDTYTCTHCSRVVVLNIDRKRERYKCRGCNHHICDDCAAKRVAGEPCKTLAQKFDEAMEKLEKSELRIILPFGHSA